MPVEGGDSGAPLAFTGNDPEGDGPGDTDALHATSTNSPASEAASSRAGPEPHDDRGFTMQIYDEPGH